MNNIKSIIFDADDTLWESARFYSEALASFIQLMSRCGFSAKEVIALSKRKDRERFKNNQYGVSLFNDSLRQIYFENVRYPTKNSIESLDRILVKHYNHPIIIRNGVLRTLKRLKDSEFKLFIYTKGELNHQTIKILRSDLLDYFNDISIVPKKDTSTLKKLIDSWKLKNQETMIVGDSFTDDIIPALNLGLHTAYISSSNADIKIEWRRLYREISYQ